MMRTLVTALLCLTVIPVGDAGAAEGPVALTVISAPRVFHPAVDGFADRLEVKVQADRPVTVRLEVTHPGSRKAYFGRPVVIAAANTTTTIRSAAHIPPGAWSWHLVATDAQGHKTATASRSVTADRRRLVTTVQTIDHSAADFRYTDYSGDCSSAHRTATVVVLHSAARCRLTVDADDVALAGFRPRMPVADRYGRIVVSISTSGGRAIALVYRGNAQVVASKHVLPPGTTTFSVPGSLLSQPHHRLQFDVGTNGGHIVRITHIRLVVTTHRLQ